MRAHCLPFAQIPHTTQLFTDFLAYSPSVRAFYPRSPQCAEWIKEESSKISYDPDRRARVWEILSGQNKSWGASAKTVSNLDRLRRGAFAVVTGQQVGLFGGTRQLSGGSQREPKPLERERRIRLAPERFFVKRKCPWYLAAISPRVAKL